MCVSCLCAICIALYAACHMCHMRANARPLICDCVHTIALRMVWVWLATMGKAGWSSLCDGRGCLCPVFPCPLWLCVWSYIIHHSIYTPYHSFIFTSLGSEVRMSFSHVSCIMHHASCIMPCFYFFWLPCSTLHAVCDSECCCVLCVLCALCARLCLCVRRVF